MRLVRSALLASILVGSVALLAAVGWPASDYRSSDFFQFWAGPHALLEGASPYDVDWSVAFHDRYGSRELRQPPLPATGTPGWTTGYPLWTFVLLLPLAVVPFEIAAASWLVAQVIAIALGLSALRDVALRAAPARDGALLIGLAFAFQPVWLTVAGGNASGFLFGLVAGSLAAALAGRAAASGALAALLTVKPQGVLLTAPALAFAQPGRRTRFFGAAAAAAVALVASSFLARASWLADWLRSAAALQSSAGSNATGWTLDRVLPLGPFVPIVAETLVVGLWLRWLVERRPEPALLVAATIPISLFAAPHGWSYDQLQLLVPAAFALGRLAALDERARRAGVVALFALVGVLPWLLYALAFARGGEEWSALTPPLLLALLVAADARAGAARRVVSPSGAGAPVRGAQHE